MYKRHSSRSNKRLSTKQRTLDRNSVLFCSVSLLKDTMGVAFLANKKANNERKGKEKNYAGFPFGSWVAPRRGACHWIGLSPTGTGNRESRPPALLARHTPSLATSHCCCPGTKLRPLEPMFAQASFHPYFAANNTRKSQQKLSGALKDPAR